MVIGICSRLFRSRMGGWDEILRRFHQTHTKSFDRRRLYRKPLFPDTGGETSSTGERVRGLDGNRYCWSFRHGCPPVQGNRDGSADHMRTDDHSRNSRITIADAECVNNHYLKRKIKI